MDYEILKSVKCLITKQLRNLEMSILVMKILKEKKWFFKDFIGLTFAQFSYFEHTDCV